MGGPEALLRGVLWRLMLPFKGYWGLVEASTPSGRVRFQEYIGVTRSPQPGWGLMKNPLPDAYGGRDPREIPIYSVPQAAHYLKMSKATLGTWVFGRHYERKDGMAYFKPPIQLSDPDSRKLSFWNLIEAHVLQSLRVDHEVSMRDVRNALDWAEDELGIDYLLRRQELHTTGGKIFIDRYGELINASQSGQIAMRMLLKEYLRHVEWGKDLLAVQYLPSPHDDSSSNRIVIDPRIGFGRPVIHPEGISTAVIVARVDAGELLEIIAEDYNLNVKAIEEAVVYERAA